MEYWNAYQPRLIPEVLGRLNNYYHYPGLKSQFVLDIQEIRHNVATSSLSCFVL